MLRELHLFAGIGGGLLAGSLLGFDLVGAVEIDPWCQHVLRSRFGSEAVVGGDIAQFDARPFQGVDLVAGGFPCEDISLAGRGAGLAGERSGLWFEMQRVVAEAEPAYVFVENSPALRTRGLDRILQGLADLGFDAEWSDLRASDVGAPHIRRRLWLLGAHPDRYRREGISPADLVAAWQREPRRGDADRLRSHVAYPSGEGLPQWPRTEAEWAHAAAAGGSWWASEPAMGRVVDGFPGHMEQVRALGKAQVPFCAAHAFRKLMERFV